MGAKYISPGDPGLHVDIVEFGVCSDEPRDVYLGSTDGVTNTTGAFPLFYVKQGVAVYDLIIDKLTAFGSTGAMTMDIGDTDADGFWPSTDLISTDAGKVSLKGFVTSTGGAKSAYANHRVYTSDDTAGTDGWIAINVTIGTAKVNAGKARAYLIWYPDTQP